MRKGSSVMVCDKGGLVGGYAFFPHVMSMVDLDYCLYVARQVLDFTMYFPILTTIENLPFSSQISKLHIVNSFMI